MTKTPRFPHTREVSPFVVGVLFMGLLVVAIPLYIVSGVLQGATWWIEDARQLWRSRAEAVKNASHS